MDGDELVRTGVTTVATDGSEFKEFKLSHEDNEFIELDPDHRYVFAGGFNGKIGVFDNTDDDFHLTKVIGPLEFQIIHAAVVQQEPVPSFSRPATSYVSIGMVKRYAGQRTAGSCVLMLNPIRPTTACCTLEPITAWRSSNIGRVEFGSIQIDQVGRHSHGLGIVKDVKPLPDGSYIAISRKGYVFKASKDGAIQWHRQVLGIPRGAAINSLHDRCLVSDG